MNNSSPVAEGANPAKLFVGNLPWSVSSDELGQLFAQYGTVVDAKVITDKFSGRSKGIAFVEYDNADSAQEAIAALNDYNLDGRQIIVNVAKPKTEGERHGGGGFNRNRGFSNRGGYGGNRDGHSGGRRGGHGGGYGGGHRSY